MVDMRHVEQKSIRPVSKEPPSEGRYQEPSDECDGPATLQNTASNEQHHVTI